MVQKRTISISLAIKICTVPDLAERYTCDSSAFLMEPLLTGVLNINLVLSTVEYQDHSVIYAGIFHGPTTHGMKEQLISPKMYAHGNIYLYTRLQVTLGIYLSIYSVASDSSTVHFIYLLLTHTTILCRLLAFFILGCTSFCILIRGSRGHRWYRGGLLCISWRNSR